MMRALSIRQPWAWLIVNGYKDVENRTWSTRVRGEIAIHAGVRIDEDGLEFVRREFPRIPLPRRFDVGGIVGRARVVDCVEEHASPWFFGPFGFVLVDASPIAFVPWRGRLGFFPVEFETSRGVL